MHAGTVHQPPRAVLDPTASNLIATENALDLTGKFTAWQRFVNSKIIPVALPLLIKISPAIQPIYSWYDGAFAQSSANLPTNSYKPIVVFSCRTLSDMQKYRNDFDRYANAAQKEGDGVRACFSFVDTDKDNTAIQVSWFDSPSDYVPQPDKLIENYTGGYTVVFGSWNDELKAAIERTTPVGKGKVEWSKGMAGFIKEATPSYADGFKTGEMPMIWISKRKIKDGMMDLWRNNWQKGVDRMGHEVAPAALAIAEFEANDEESHVWSLRIFNSFSKGYNARLPFPSWALFRMAFNIAPTWEAFPIGYCFSLPEDIAGAVEANPGNKRYRQYAWGRGLIGPEPDFAKGL